MLGRKVATQHLAESSAEIAGERGVRNLRRAGQSAISESNGGSQLGKHTVGGAEGRYLCVGETEFIAGDVSPT